MGRARRMSRCRSTCPRNAEISNRGSEPRKRAPDFNRIATEHRKCHAKDPGQFQPKAWTSDLVALRGLNSKVTHMTIVWAWGRIDKRLELRSATGSNEPKHASSGSDGGRRNSLLSSRGNRSPINNISTELRFLQLFCFQLTPKFWF